MKPNLRHVLLFGALVACKHEVTSPEPALSAVAPDLVCNASSVSGTGGTTSVTLTGVGFTPMPSQTLKDPRQLLLPKVTLAPVAAIPGGVVPPETIAIADNPTDPTASRVHWTSEEHMGFDVVPSDALPTGVYNVTVTNPDGSHASTLDQVLAILPPPLVTMVQPPAVCDDQSNQTIVITGSSFLVFDGATPTVTLTTPTGLKTYPTTAAAADCTAIPGTFVEHDATLCTAISFVIDRNDIVVTTNTMIALVVTNPAPADCASSAGVSITIDAPPKVDSVAPATVCEGGGQLTINGENFDPGATVTLDCAGTMITSTTATVNAAGTQIAATFGGGAPPNTTCDVIVRNADGCVDVPPPHKKVSVQTGPIAFFVDPPVVFNGINTRITIFSTTIATPLPANAVTITLNGTSTMLQFNTVPNFPNRLQAIVPINQPPGVYDLTLEDGVNCPTTLPAAFTVTSTTTVTLKRLSPPFGATATDTAVTILRDTAATAPNNHPFVETPRVFLNPTNPVATDIAVPLESVAFLDGDRATGVVPAGTPVHTYDVVLVNPDGTVGVLRNGYTETATAPPEIDTATPSSIVAATGQAVTLGGTSFAAGDTVALICVDAMGNPLVASVATLAPSCTGTACTQKITINGSALTVGAVCVVELTNPDGTFSDFSAIGVTNSSLNLSAPRVGPDMNVGRRALVAAAGNATAANRFVYAIGGDAGTAAGALASVEFAPVDLFGKIGPFVVQPPALRAPRTLAGSVTVGRYVYVVGGNDGIGAVATAERALILSPRETPQVTDVDLQLAATGPPSGEYHYRVSAVFSATDPDNPGGESLASDEFTIKIPVFTGKQFVLSLLWRAPVDALGATLPNVVGYRIYRTIANGAPGSEVLVGTTAATPRIFVDDGTATPGTAVPLPLGTTGAWAALPTMTTKREGVGLAFARDPVAPSTFYVYALLGRSTPLTANTSYEFLPVTIATNGHQAAGASWTTGTLATAQGRWQLGAWTVDSTVSSAYVAPTTYVFLGGGQTAAGSAANKVEAGLVSAGGQLLGGASPTLLDDTPKDFSANVAGYGVCAANGQLFTFGGANGAPSKGATSASLISPPPTLANNSWNSEGLTLTHGRYLLGSAVQSSFIFLLGGQTDEPSAASKTTELVIW